MSGSPNWVDNSGYSHLELFPNGNYKSFIPTIDTMWRVGTEDVKLSAGHIVQFYDNGQFKSFTLAETVLIHVHGVAVQALAGTIVEFYENGNVKMVTLAEQKRGFFRSSSWVYRGKTLQPGLVVK